MPFNTLYGKNLHAPDLPPIRAACPTLLILKELINLIKSGEQ